MSVGGYLREYWRITVESIKMPSRFFQGLAEEGIQYLKPLVYALMSFLIYLLGILTVFMFSELTKISFSLRMISILLAALLVYFLIAAASIFFYAVLMHLAVRLVGGSGGFNRTFKVVCYSYSPLNLLWVPALIIAGMLSLKNIIAFMVSLPLLLILFAGMLYMYYLVVVGISVTSTISKLRALAALVIQLIIYTIIIIAASVLLIGAVFYSSSGFKYGAPPKTTKPVPSAGTYIPAEEYTPEFPSAEIWLDKNYTVHRTDVKNDNGRSLAWVVVYNGKKVLQRNARGETEYEYYRRDPGTYTIYLEQFVDGQYRVISNVVSYEIE